VKRPAFMFYPGDWLRDTALVSCSLAARGLWIHMICLMHEGCPYGHLRVGAKVIGSANLARMVGSTAAEIKALLAELREAGVLSETEDGTIYSRRMVKDEKHRAARAAGGIKSLENPNVPRPKDTLQGYPPTPSLGGSLAVADAFAVPPKTFPARPGTIVNAGQNPRLFDAVPSL